MGVPTNSSEEKLASGMTLYVRFLGMPAPHRYL